MGCRKSNEILCWDLRFPVDEVTKEKRRREEKRREEKRREEKRREEKRSAVLTFFPAVSKAREKCKHEPTDWI